MRGLERWPNSLKQYSLAILRERRHDEEETLRNSALNDAFELAEYLVELERSSPVRDYSSPEELERELDLTLGEGRDMASLKASLRRLFDATPRIGGPRFFSLLFGGHDAAATTAEILTALANTPMHTWKAAGAMILVEREVLRHMASKIGFAGGDGMFTPGGTMSNLAALVVARNEALPDARDHGLGGERCRVYTSIDGHFSIARAMGITGLGRRNVRDVPSDARGHIDVGALARMIAADARAGIRPLMINATAGTTTHGAFDPLREIAEVAAEHGVWLHVDGSYGGSVALSERHRALLDGCERVDSFAWDAHKAMGVPLSCSVLLVRHAGLLEKHFNESAEYLFQTHDDGHNPARRSLQCARRNDALKLWAAWRRHGDAGYARRIDRLFDLARKAVAMIEADPDLRLCLEPESFNVCFEVRGASSAEICDRLEREARLLVSHVPAGGRQAIRLVCINPEISEADLETFFQEVKMVAAGIRGKPNPLASRKPESSTRWPEPAAAGS